jgi:predicted DNA-binding transcriptional regulator YafY
MSVSKLRIWSLTLLLAGCATAPAHYTFNNSQTYLRSYDEIWEDLVRFFATSNIQIKNIAKDSGVIYAETSRYEDDFADCGSPGLSKVMGRALNLNVFVSRSSNAPKVHVNTKFLETRQFDRSVWTVECNSRGIIERAILNSLR